LTDSVWLAYLSCLKGNQEATKLVWIAFSEGRFITVANVVRSLVPTVVTVIIAVFLDVRLYMPTFQKIQLPPSSLAVCLS
jgi:hypothetical protein